MSSVVTSPRTANGFFVSYASLTSGTPKILSYTGGSGAGGSTVPGSFSTATWANGAVVGSGTVSTILGGAGAMLRDGGKTVVSSSRVFRKVNLFNPALGTGGVGGAAGTAYPQSDYLSGYIELPAASLDNNAVTETYAPVVYMPRYAF
jgi:hypothetical protein